MNKTDVLIVMVGLVAIGLVLVYWNVIVSVAHACFHVMGWY